MVSCARFDLKDISEIFSGIILGILSNQKVLFVLNSGGVRRWLVVQDLW